MNGYRDSDAPESERPYWNRRFFVEWAKLGIEGDEARRAFAAGVLRRSVASFTDLAAHDLCRLTKAVADTLAQDDAERLDAAS